MPISAESTKKLIDKMINDGIDLSVIRRWGFYFYSLYPESLNKVIEELNGFNYSVEGIDKIENGEYRLYVSKTESMALEKLIRRNTAFNELAKSIESVCYDGWDVDVQNG